MTFDIVPADPKRRIVTTYGKYTVWYDPLSHMPWGTYRVYRGAKYCGGQISWPSLSDCEWHDQWGGQYATPSSERGINEYGYSAERYRRKGRQRKVDAEQELQEAMAA